MPPCQQVSPTLAARSVGQAALRDSYRPPLIGWRPRHAAGADDELVEKNQFRTQDRDVWEQASRWIYSLYDVDEGTVVVVNGHQAQWIQQGVEDLPKALFRCVFGAAT